jgi:hypothetical protein
MLTQTVAVTKVGTLILARLLAPSSRLNPVSLRKDVEPFFRGRETGAWHDLLGETVAGLEREGLITLKPLALTESGRVRALECLGLDSMPAKVNWKQIKSKFLVAVAFGIPVDDAQQRKQVATADGLRVAILKARYQLPNVKTMAQALDALVRQALDMGATEKLTMPVLKAKVLGGFLKLLGNPALKEFKAQLPVDAVKANRNTVEELQAGVLRNWFAEESVDESQPANDEAAATSPETPPVETAPHRFDLADFASRVRAVAGASETGRFGDNKVFISHVWRALQNENDFPDMTESEFKTHLTEANHAGLLSLSRADLVEVMAPADVEASEARYLHAVFHFIQV